MLGLPVVLPVTLSSTFSRAPLLPASEAGLIAGSPEYITEESARVLKTAPFTSLFHLTSMSLISLTSTSSSVTNSGSSSCYQESKNKHVRIHTKNFIKTHRKVMGWMKLLYLIIYGTGKFSSNIVSYLVFFLFILFLFNFFFIQNIFKSTARNVVNISILSTNKKLKFGSHQSENAFQKSELASQTSYFENEILVFSQFFY